MQSNNWLWLHVALGVFLGLMAAGGVSYLAFVWHVNKAMDIGDEVMTRTLENLERENAEVWRTNPPVRQVRISPGRSEQPVQRPLSDNERCLGGTRLQKVNDGWVQIGSC